MCVELPCTPDDCIEWGGFSKDELKAYEDALIVPDGKKFVEWIISYTNATGTVVNAVYAGGPLTVCSSATITPVFRPFINVCTVIPGIDDVCKELISEDDNCPILTAEWFVKNFNRDFQVSDPYKFYGKWYAYDKINGNLLGLIFDESKPTDLSLNVKSDCSDIVVKPLIRKRDGYIFGLDGGNCISECFTGNGNYYGATLTVQEKWVNIDDTADIVYESAPNVALVWGNSVSEAEMLKTDGPKPICPIKVDIYKQLNDWNGCGTYIVDFEVTYKGVTIAVHADVHGNELQNTSYVRQK